MSPAEIRRRATTRDPAAELLRRPELVFRIDVQANNGGAAVQLPAAEARELAEAAALAEAQWREEQATESAATGVVMASREE